MRRRLGLVLGVTWIMGGAMLASAQDAPAGGGDNVRREAVRREVREWDARNKSLYETDAGHLVRAGLVADKGAHEVTIKAVATGLGGGNGGAGGAGGGEAVVFFLIGPSSSKSYEALAVSFAKPSDVYEALRFVGLPQGRAVNYSRNRFWPRGERVVMRFGWEETSPEGVVSKRSARAEDLLVLRQTKEPLPPTGLVFVGNEGQFVEPLNGGGGGKQYYGDMGDPGSIASNYNDATTVMDLPNLARQSEVYQSRVVNPAYRFKAEQALEVTIKWETPGVLRVVDVDLNAEGGDGKDLKAVRFTLKGEKTLAEGVDAAGMVDALTRLVAEKEPFVLVHPGEGMTLKTVRQMYVLLESLQTEKGIRLEPPGEKGGEKVGWEAGLFHEAFTPDEGLRDYRKRTWQPVEVHFGADGKVLLRDFEEKAVTAEGEAWATPKDNPVTSPADLKKMLADRAENRKPVAVYAPAGMRYGEMMKWLGPALTGEEVVWVYLE
jgi:hypothetical protein